MAFGIGNALSIRSGYTGIPFWDAVFVSDIINPETGENALVSPGYIGPLRPDTPWSTVRLGRQFLPGACEVRCGRKRKKDTKAANGKDGGRTTYRGYTLAEVNIDVLIWLPEQWNMLVRQMHDLMPPPGKSTVQAFDIAHPLTQFFNIRSVVVEDAEVVPTEPKGARMVKLKCGEFMPSGSKSATKTPTASVDIRPNYDKSKPPPAVAKPGVNYTAANEPQPTPSNDSNFTNPDNLQSLP